MVAPALSAGLDNLPASKHGARVSMPGQFENGGKDVHNGCKGIGYGVRLRHQGRVADDAWTANSSFCDPALEGTRRCRCRARPARTLTIDCVSDLH